MAEHIHAILVFMTLDGFHSLPDTDNKCVEISNQKDSNAICESGKVMVIEEAWLEHVDNDCEFDKTQSTSGSRDVTQLVKNTCDNFTQCFLRPLQQSTHKNLKSIWTKHLTVVIHDTTVTTSYTSTLPIPTTEVSLSLQSIAGIAGGVTGGAVVVFVIVIFLRRRLFSTNRESSQESSGKSKDISNTTYNFALNEFTRFADSEKAKTNSLAKYSVVNKPQKTFNINDEYSTANHNTAASHFIDQNINSDKRNTYDHWQVENTGLDTYDHANNCIIPNNADNIYDHSYSKSYGYDHTTCVSTKLTAETSTTYDSYK